MEPKFDLEQVRQLIEKSNADDHMFTSTRALNPVVSNLQKTQVEAQEFILEQISKLEEKNFCERMYMNKSVYDIYGKTIENIPWYIKFSVIDDDKGQFIDSISFHPTEKALKTNSETLQAY